MAPVAFVRDCGAGLGALCSRVLDAAATFLEREAGHVAVLLLLMFWGYDLMRSGVDFGQRLSDQAFGALLYAMNIRK